ncbi:Nucleoside triphosphate pyrophosphohydrolase MazG [Candidatus Syntrophocurvum alkaliphilum]|uniref:Nucleoside triphosphate pyrophosphohydrolase MazG n=2 Tax=Candidatus Syntrophocurvum alkaliphilum TaxID=2293317 RepID=A0A6I6DNK3_9FIRM|nr:Nucleoside triphosphate pyrophosphohydrolase MazG [Candidatus Syntrophocurvum alkaliphilum]
MKELLEVMDKLLSPEGCPWDREQTHESLTRYMIEETYETIDAIKENDMDKLREELGDLLLQVVFHSKLAENKSFFTFDDVVKTVTEKMISRHPHVFSNMNLSTSDDVMQNWEEFKKKEGKKTTLEGIPNTLPALMRAEKMQTKASRVGFDWPDVNGAVEKVIEEAKELSQANNEDEIIEETGDLLFAVVNIARMKNVDPEKALQRCNDKFLRRFNYIEQKIKANGNSLTDATLQDMDFLWDEAKTNGL